jgi:hypothetical protein
MLIRIIECYTFLSYSMTFLFTFVFDLTKTYIELY